MREAILRGHVWLLATVMPLVVKLLPLKRVLAVVTPPEWLTPYAGIAPKRIGEIVRRRLRHVRVMRHRQCLRKGLTLFHLLRLAGVPAALHFGVFAPRPEQDHMHAHCWVTVGEECLSDPPDAPVAVVLQHGCDVNAATNPGV